MSGVPATRSIKYSLRPRVERFDLLHSPYNMVRTKMERRGVTKIFVPAKRPIKRKIKCEPPSSYEHEAEVKAMNYMNYISIKKEVEDEEDLYVDVESLDDVGVEEEKYVKFASSLPVKVAPKEDQVLSNVLNASISSKKTVGSMPFAPITPNTSYQTSPAVAVEAPSHVFTPAKPITSGSRIASTVSILSKVPIETKVSIETKVPIAAIAPIVSTTPVLSTVSVVSPKSVVSVASPKSVSPFDAPNDEWKQGEKTLRKVLQDHKMRPGSFDASKPAFFADLKEESLFEIFHHLSLNDLCATVEVSPHLKTVAQKYFEVIYTSLNISWLIEDGAEQFTLFQAKRLLQCFGHLISTLIVDTKKMANSERDMEKLLELIGVHCHGCLLFWNKK